MQQRPVSTSAHRAFAPVVAHRSYAKEAGTSQVSHPDSAQRQFAVLVPLSVQAAGDVSSPPDDRWAREAAVFLGEASATSITGVTARGPLVGIPCTHARHPRGTPAAIGVALRTIFARQEIDQPRALGFLGLPTELAHVVARRPGEDTPAVTPGRALGALFSETAVRDALAARRLADARTSLAAVACPARLDWEAIVLLTAHCHRLTVVAPQQPIDSSLRRLRQLLLTSIRALSRSGSRPGTDDTLRRAILHRRAAPVADILDELLARDRLRFTTRLPSVRADVLLTAAQMPLALPTAPPRGATRGLYQPPVEQPMHDSQGRAHIALTDTAHAYADPDAGRAAAHLDACVLETALLSLADTPARRSSSTADLGGLESLRDLARIHGFDQSLAPRGTNVQGAHTR